MRTWHCTTCGDDREFAQPACPDGHTADGGECPEWFCVECGGAVVVEVVRVLRSARAGRRAA